MVARIADAILDALGAAHAAGVVHRDLKPENVFLVAAARSSGDAAPIVKILDFGIAKILGASAPASATATGAVMGTVGYMSPEQVRDTAHVDHQADLWAVAAIVYEAITGRQAFGAPTASDVIVAILSGPPA